MSAAAKNSKSEILWHLKRYRATDVYRAAAVIIRYSRELSSDCKRMLQRTGTGCQKTCKMRQSPDPAEVAVERLESLNAIQKGI